MYEIYSVQVPTLDEGIKAPQRFIDDLQFVRKTLGISKRALARSLQTDHTDVIKWERGEKWPNIGIYETIRRWADTLRT